MVASSSEIVDQESIDRVVTAVSERWQILGKSSQVFSWVTLAEKIGLEDPENVVNCAVVVPELRRIECVVGGWDEMERAFREFEALIDRNWHVSTLVPIRAMGAAHVAFRGLSISLQGWWARNDDPAPHFSSPEVP